MNLKFSFKSQIQVLSRSFGSLIGRRIHIPACESQRLQHPPIAKLARIHSNPNIWHKSIEKSSENFNKFRLSSPLKLRNPKYCLLFLSFILTNTVYRYFADVGKKLLRLYKFDLFYFCRRVLKL